MPATTEGTIYLQVDMTSDLTNARDEFVVPTVDHAMTEVAKFSTVGTVLILICYGLFTIVVAKFFKSISRRTYRNKVSALF